MRHNEGSDMLGCVRISLLLCLSMLLAADAALAGKLSDFERDATESRSDDDRDRHDPAGDETWDDSYLYHHHADSSDGIVDGFVAALLIWPGQLSWARAATDADALVDWNAEPREPGEPMIPIVRFDAAYQNVESDVEALDLRLQLGYGPLGFEINQTRYEEDEPPDHLDLYRLYGLWRMSYGERIEVDLGLGGIILDGEERNSGFSATTPILIQPWDWLLVEFRPMWSNIHGSHINEYELGLLLNWKWAAFKAGYRWTHSPNESLDGPFLGLSIRY
jgi:hypothetical protein